MLSSLKKGKEESRNIQSGSKLVFNLDLSKIDQQRNSTFSPGSTFRKSNTSISKCLSKSPTTSQTQRIPDSSVHVKPNNKPYTLREYQKNTKT